MTLAEMIFDGMHYVQQTRTCNKPTCRCHEGQPHGPYWYVRSMQGGPLKYVGKELPKGLVASRAALDKQFARISAARDRVRAQQEKLRRQIDALEYTAVALENLATGFKVSRRDLPKEFLPLLKVSK